MYFVFFTKRSDKGCFESFFLVVGGFFLFGEYRYFRVLRIGGFGVGAVVD